jgi:hypothetical protein
MEIAQELDVPLPADQCYNLLSNLNRELGWKVVDRDSRTYTLKLQKGNYWWSRRLYLNIDLKPSDSAKTEVHFRLWEPIIVFGLSGLINKELRQVISRFETDVTALGFVVE